jgi:hypothetical protein
MFHDDIFAAFSMPRVATTPRLMPFMLSSLLSHVHHSSARRQRSCRH